MKSFAKACSIIGGIFLLVGIMMITLALAAKGPQLLGDAFSFMEVSKLVKVKSGKELSFQTNGAVVDGNKIEGIEELVLNLGGCSFETVDSEDQYFYVNQSGTNKVQVKTDGSTCYITYEESAISIKSAPEIRLYIPKGAVIKNATMDFGAGEFDIHRLQVNNLQVNMGAGELNLEELVVDNADLTLGVGSLCIDHAVLSSTLNVDCAMGSVEITLEGSEKDYNINADCTMGDISIGGKHFSNDGNSDNNASKTINADCSMGSIEINFE